MFNDNKPMTIRTVIPIDLRWQKIVSSYNYRYLSEFSRGLFMLCSELMVSRSVYRYMYTNIIICKNNCDINVIVFLSVTFTNRCNFEIQTKWSMIYCVVFCNIVQIKSKARSKEGIEINSVRLAISSIYDVCKNNHNRALM